MKQDVEDYVKQCSVCQQAKHMNSLPAGLLAPLPIPEGAWQHITMDFVEGLPISNGYNAILVVVDRFTKCAHFLGLKHPFTAAQIAKLVLDNIVKLHGLPSSIVTDRDKIFVSAFWKELFKLYDITLQLSTAYHPQTDGQTERVNQCLEMYLRCSVYDSSHSHLTTLQFTLLYLCYLILALQICFQRRFSIAAWSRRATMPFLKCWSNGLIFRRHPRPGKISTLCSAAFLPLLLGDKQVLQPGEMSRRLHHRRINVCELSTCVWSVSCLAGSIGQCLRLYSLVWV